MCRTSIGRGIEIAVPNLIILFQCRRGQLRQPSYGAKVSSLLLRSTKTDVATETSVTCFRSQSHVCRIFFIVSHFVKKGDCVQRRGI